MQMARETEQEKEGQRRVQFNNVVTVTEIPTHRMYTFNERLSVWYTDVDYRCFKLQESLENLKANKTKCSRSKRIDEIRFKVLNAQTIFQDSIQQPQMCRFLSNAIEEGVTMHGNQFLADHLAEFYRCHSTSCVDDARKRGLENFIWNLSNNLQDSFRTQQDHVLAMVFESSYKRAIRNQSKSRKSLPQESFRRSSSDTTLNAIQRSSATASTLASRTVSENRNNRVILKNSLSDSDTFVPFGSDRHESSCFFRNQNNDSVSNQLKIERSTARCHSW
jgi:hypothetical protein